MAQRGHRVPGSCPILGISSPLVKPMSKLATLSLAVLGLVVPLAMAHAKDEPAVKGDAAALPYLNAVHAKVHPLWADNFLPLATSQLPKDHPINKMSRRVDLQVVLSAKGALLDVRVGKSSGSDEFDASAMEAVRTAGRFPAATEAVLSDDGKVHLRWALARDDRRCSDLAITRPELPLTEAVKAMVTQGRIEPALARLQAADDDERTAGLDAFARAWLDRMANDKKLSLMVAALDALAGDDRGAERLRQAVGKLDTPEDLARWVARGLAALKIPICPLFEGSQSKTKTEAERESTTDEAKPDGDDPLAKLEQEPGPILALLTAGAEGGCLRFALRVATDSSQTTDNRLAALECLSHSDTPEARAALRTLAKSPDSKIASRAILGEARPGAGRGAIFRLIPRLRDKSLDIRAAAATALVRVGGEDVLPQLFLVFKEKKPNLYAMVSDELAKLAGAPSAGMLARFLRKDARDIKLAAARAIAARQDENVAKLKDGLAASEDTELQLLAGRALPKEKREAAIGSSLNDQFRASYTALLHGDARIIAADWLLARFPQLDQTSRTELVGEWLATRPKPE